MGTQLKWVMTATKDYVHSKPRSPLTAKFRLGEQTGNKADPAAVARSMQCGLFGYDKDFSGSPGAVYKRRPPDGKPSSKASHLFWRSPGCRVLCEEYSARFA